MAAKARKSLVAALKSRAIMRDVRYPYRLSMPDSASQPLDGWAPELAA
jgi:hypothetical protein